MTLAEELKRFNEHRKSTYGFAPRPERPLPLEPTGVGGDVPPPTEEDMYGARDMGR